MPKRYTKDCTHIKVTGVRCGSPALRGEQFCYFHQRMLRTVKSPPQSRVHHAALLEDEEAIQASLMEVVNALLRGTIEVKRAELVLRALNTAVRNARRAKFGNSIHMVTEIPDYPEPPATDTDTDVADDPVENARRIEAARQATRAEIARIRAEHEQPAATSTTHVKIAAPEHPPSAAHVGTAAPGCPSGPAVSGRSAVELKGPTALSAKVSTSVPDPTRRKPPQSVRARAPKERKKKRVC